MFSEPMPATDPTLAMSRVCHSWQPSSSSTWRQPMPSSVWPTSLTVLRIWLSFESITPWWDLILTHSISSFTTSCQSSVPTLNSCSFPQSTTSLSGECFCQWTAAVMKNCLFCIFDRIFTIYTRTLPLDIACRVWDMFCRDGDSFLFRTALGTCVECIAWKYTLFPFYMWPHTYTCTHTHTHTHTHTRHFETLSVTTTAVLCHWRCRAVLRKAACWYLLRGSLWLYRGHSLNSKAIWPGGTKHYEWSKQMKCCALSFTIVCCVCVAFVPTIFKPLSIKFGYISAIIYSTIYSAVN